MIIGQSISLRALQNSDSQQILEWVNNPELRHYIGTTFPVSELEHEGWFEKRAKDSVNKMFSIIDNSDGKFVGVIGFKQLDYINRSAELYIYIGDIENRGKGYGSKAVELLVDFAFNELNLHRMALEVYSYNKMAIKTYEKVGFEVEGILKESKYAQGKYHDRILMAKINKSTHEGTK